MPPQTAPDFTLPGTDGKTHSLADYADKPILVLVQSCNHCPYVQAYEDRIIALQSEFADRGVKVVAINSNDTVSYPADSFDRMVERAQLKNFNFDYLHDKSQAVARALGAQRTPEVFVYDGPRRLRYHGGIDDSWDNARAVTRRPLHDAITALLEGRDPAPASTPAVGCTVKWRA